MDFNITVNRKFTINGKEYGSIEEMPDDVREQYKKVMGLLAADPGRKAGPSFLEKKIVFNATLGAGETGAVSPAIDSTKVSSDMRKPGSFERVRADDMSQPARFEPLISARMLIVCVILGVLLFLFFYFKYGR